MSTVRGHGYYFSDEEHKILDALVYGPLSADQFDLTDEAFVSQVELGVIEHEDNLVSFNLERYLVVSNSNWDPTQ